MFWGITLENGKRYSQTVDSAFHVSMAALECNATEAAKKKNVSVMIEHDGTEFLLCSLQHGCLMQQNLDLNFNEGEAITFFVSGPGTVHLTGYQEGEGLDDLDDESDSFLVSDNSEDELEEADDDDDEIEDLDEDKEDSEIEIQQKRKMKQSVAGPKRKMARMIEPPVITELPDVEETEKIKESKKSDLPSKKNEKATPKQPTKQHKPAEKHISEEKKETAKEKKALDESQINGTETPSPGKRRRRNKKKSSMSSEGNLNSTLNESEVKKPETPSAKNEQLRKKRAGVEVHDILEGNGPSVKPGKFIHISYTGKLTNGKVFDSSKSKLFGFRVGKGEVIKGMEIGVEDMKVGGKRKIIIPPNQGYGAKRTGPIPPNSTLIFEIELKSVKN